MLKEAYYNASDEMEDINTEISENYREAANQLQESSHV